MSSDFIEDRRIVSEVDTALDYLSAVSIVYKRDGKIHKDYLSEKVEGADRIIKWLKNFYEEDR